MKYKLNTLEINIQSISFDCPKCKEIVFLEGMGLIGHSRKHNFEHNKGHVRCDACGFLLEYEFDGDLILKIDPKGMSCGVCGKIVNRLFDNYFCKEHYIEHTTEEAKRWAELSQKEIDKINGLDT